MIKWMIYEILSCARCCCRRSGLLPHSFSTSVPRRRSSSHFCRCFTIITLRRRLRQIASFNYYYTRSQRFFSDEFYWRWLPAEFDKKNMFNVEHWRLFGCFSFLRHNRYQTATTNLIRANSTFFFFSCLLHKGIFLLPTNVNFCSLKCFRPLPYAKIWRIRHNQQTDRFDITSRVIRTVRRPNLKRQS